MKSIIHRDGRIDLDGTPEELAAYERARLPIVHVDYAPPASFTKVFSGFESAEIGLGRPSAVGRGVVPVFCRCGAVGFDPESPRPRLEVLHGEQHTPEACVGPQQVNPDAPR